jgi:hypothetical protein
MLEGSSQVDSRSLASRSTKTRDFCGRKPSTKGSLPSGKMSTVGFTSSSAKRCAVFAHERRLPRSGVGQQTRISTSGPRVGSHHSRQYDQVDYSTKKTNFRMADNPSPIQPARFPMRPLNAVSPLPGECSYLLVGTLRCGSSKKFSRKITWLCACCASGVSTGMSAAMRLPAGATS